MKHLLILSILIVGISTIACKSKSSEETASTPQTLGTVPTGDAYKIDAARTELKWMAFKPTGNHYGIVPVNGGTIFVKDGNINGGIIDINMSGLEVQGMDGEMKESLQSHLRGTTPGKEEDFFNVAKYPSATFTIVSTTKLENDPVGTHMINGNLTIKDITKPISFKATIDLASGSAMKATTEPFVIDRTLWDIKYKSKKFFSDLKDDFINDEIKIEITLGAIKE
jgi:hypothetical protein